MEVSTEGHMVVKITRAITDVTVHLTADEVADILRVDSRLSSGCRTINALIEQLRAHEAATGESVARA